jgi:DNA-binding transcriptional LysR family regulator
MKFLLLLGMVFIFTACGSPSIATPAPTPEAINVTYPASLPKWTDSLAQCAAARPLVALYVDQTNRWTGELSKNEVALEYTQPINDTSGFYLTQLGWEQLVVVVNQANPLTSLSADQLIDIFSGQTSSWAITSSQPIQVWIFPDGNPLRIIFDQAVMQARSITAEAMLAPDPIAMLEAVSGNAYSIGYLPASWITKNNPGISAKVKTIQLDNILSSELHQPVIAISQGEPSGLLRELLACLASGAP